MPIHTENFELKRQIADLHAELAACKQRTHTEYMRGVHDGRMQCGDCEQLATVTSERDIAVDALELMKRDKWHWQETRDKALAAIQQSKGEV